MKHLIWVLSNFLIFTYLILNNNYKPILTFALIIAMVTSMLLGMIIIDDQIYY